MKVFFWLMLVASVISALYGIRTVLTAVSHNQYAIRHTRLKATTPESDHSGSRFGLTPNELAHCDSYFADAYRKSVEDGDKLGAGVSALGRQCFVLTVLLFGTSLMGLRSVRCRAMTRRMVNQGEAHLDQS